jgi:hypothetical protein
MTAAADPSAASDDDYAIWLADASHDWYRTAAIRSRRSYRVSETAILVVSAAVPLAGAIEPRNAVIPAILGAVVVILSGMRAIFHWQENYLRFSNTRELIEAERRLYRTSCAPYDDAATRSMKLAAAVTRIEREEMGGWSKIANERPTV